MPQPKKKQDFESTLGKLEKLVTDLEDGDLSLEKAIKTFEDGMGLVATCEKQLNEAQKKVEVLVGKTVEPFEEQE